MQNKSFWKEKIKVGNLEFPRFMSAPIDGIIDSPTRQLIRLFSKEALLFGQMRHVATIANAKALDEFNYVEDENPICFQISANNKNFIKPSIEKILDKKFDMINLNIGCPAKKVIGSGCGSALMENIPMLEQIVIEVQNATNSKVPVTAKIRAGFKEKNGFDVALMLQDLGIEMLIIHPRLQTESFIGKLDFDLVRKIKEKLKIPVIFSGDLIDAESVKKTYELSGVDGFMIGRALYGAPWKIKQIMSDLEDKEFSITLKKQIDIALKHLELNSKFYGEKNGFNILKKHLPLYIKGIDGACKIRNQLVLSNSEQEMRKVLESLIKRI